MREVRVGWGWKGVALCLTAIFLQVACSHTMVVSPLNEGDRAKLKRAVRGRMVKLETSEKKEKGRVVTLEGTNLKWRPAELMETRTIPLTDVRRITWRDRKRGFLEGFIIGAGATGTYILLQDISQGDAPCAYDTVAFCWLSMLIMGTVGGLMGFVVGSHRQINVKRDVDHRSFRVFLDYDITLSRHD